VSATEKTCACGSTFTIDTGELSGRFAEVLLRARRMCDPCAATERARQVADDAEREARSAATTWARNVKASGMPTALPADIDQLTDGPGVGRETVRAWAYGEGPPILVLTGPIGTGKTTLAAAAFHHRLRRRPGYWRTVPILLSHLSAGFGTQAHDEAVQLLDGRRMLALDDIDKARPTEYAAERIFAAVDACYAHRTPLIVTTNLATAALAERWPEPFGAAITSRLTDRATARAVRIDGDDRRQQDPTTTTTRTAA
jgi:DNA replication protein DnaC